MLADSFQFARTPNIVFGPGKFAQLADYIADYGSKVLIVTGGSSLYKSGYFDKLTTALEEEEINYFNVKVEEEPSPDLVDELAVEYRSRDIDVVAAVGGGSVMDTGKAVSAMLPQEEAVMNYLEVVGAGQTHPGTKVPFIAVPTTSGTGSEATKNAVLRQVGEDGFKKSLRHDNFIPDIALVDPELTISCPPAITAASGLDAVTQLLGAYTSTEANPVTDSLALKGLEYAGKSLVPAATDQADNVQVRAGMAYGSLISGIVLANAGLGIVHGFASSIGGYFDIPHGVVCGTLLGEATRLNIKLLKQENKTEYLKKYAQAGAVLAGENLEVVDNRELDIDKYCNLLIETIDRWIAELDISRLGEYGVQESDLEKIASATGNKNNPIKLNTKQIKKIMANRL